MSVLDLGQPTCRLLYKGMDISGPISSWLISLTFTDNLEGQADDIQMEMRNDDLRWQDAWFPELNDRIQGFLGYKGGRLLDMGTFFLDEPAISGSRHGDTFTIRGQSKPVDKALKTKKTAAFEKQSQAQIARKVLSGAGLDMIGTPPDISFESLRQRREFDLEFLHRMASDYGCFFAVKGGSAVYANRDDLFGQDPVRTLARGDRSILHYNGRHTAHGTYSSAKASYFDGKAKKLHTAEAKDSGISTGDVLKIDDRVESPAHAKHLCKSRLQKANMKAWTMEFDLVGDPSCQAGMTVKAAGYGRWDRKYIIHSARHVYSRRSYETNIELQDASGNAA